MTDGTDTAAQTVFPGTTFTFTALYTGSLGNQVTLSLAIGSKANTWRLTVSLPGLQPEVYDNIGGTGATFWTALAAAVNQGQGPQRGPRSSSRQAPAGRRQPRAHSRFPSAAAMPAAMAQTGSTVTLLVGNDVLPRTGMYALRGQGCGIALLADADDPQHWTDQAGFGLQEGIYVILTGPAGDTITERRRREAAGRPG